MIPTEEAVDPGGHGRIFSISSERQPLLQPSADDQNSSPASNALREDNNALSNGEQDEPKPQQRLQAKDIFKLGAVILCFFLMGVLQTAVGALISDIEQYYDLKDGPTASIFVAQVAGYLCGTAMVEQIHLRLGRRGIAVLSPLARLFAVALLSSRPSFTFAMPMYALLGFGTALVDTAWCAWASGLPFANICQGMMHGSFSLGCVLAPMAATAVLKKGFAWYGFYRFAVPFYCLELVVQGLAFRHDNAASYRLHSDDLGATGSIVPLKLAAPWMCGLFFFVYMGIEQSLSDWIILFMRRVRHTPSLTSSLASSSFWAGMATGRVALGFVTERFGLAGSVSVYILLSTTFQILFRELTGPTTSLVFLGLNGFFCGPLFPSAILLLATKLPRQGHVSAAAAAMAMGQIGGAVAPLGIGLLADRFGIGHLLDVVLVLHVAMLAVWVVFARKT